MPIDYSLEANPPNQILNRKYACDDDWTCRFLGTAEIGHIATRWDDQPFITPMLFWYDPEHHTIYFHSNVVGRLQANVERHPKVCFEACRMGKLLPSNTALEFSMQYESAVAFGNIRLVEDDEEKRYSLYGLISKYFPGMTPGKEYRPITEAELAQTAVFAIPIESWSGKRNWKERASQSEDWQPLGLEWFE